MKPMKDRLSIRAVSLGDDLREIAPQAQKLGYSGIQLDLAFGELKLAELSGSGRREVRHLISSANLELESLRGALPADLLRSGTDHDRVLWILKRGIETAAAMSVGTLCFDLGCLPGVERKAPARATRAVPASSLIIIPDPAEVAALQEPEPPVTQEELASWSGIDAVMHEVGDIADRAGVVLAFSSELSSYASLARLLEGAQCPWFGVDLDPVSVLRDRWDLERVLDVVGSSLRHVRGRDAVRGSAGRTQPANIGQGSTDWQQMLGALDAGAFGGWIAIDTVDLPDRSSAARDAIRYLKPR